MRNDRIVELAHDQRELIFQLRISTAILRRIFGRCGQAEEGLLLLDVAIIVGVIAARQYVLQRLRIAIKAAANDLRLGTEQALQDAANQRHRSKDGTDGVGLEPLRHAIRCIDVTRPDEQRGKATNLTVDGS
ncbi:MAG: hypothetical protein U5M50_00990 [Sphingobium sp.]|nr:hypothetical protein [Sphingobium sp.]